MSGRVVPTPVLEMGSLLPIILSWVSARMLVYAMIYIFLNIIAAPQLHLSLLLQNRSLLCAVALNVSRLSTTVLEQQLIAGSLAHDGGILQQCCTSGECNGNSSRSEENISHSTTFHNGKSDK